MLLFYRVKFQLFPFDLVPKFVVNKILLRLKKKYMNVGSALFMMIIKVHMNFKTHRMRTIALDTFKIVDNKCPLLIQELVVIKNYNFRYVNTAEVPRLHTATYGMNSFRYEAARVWNSRSQMRQEKRFKYATLT